ncbi:hypothetical protein HL42_7522 [Trichophyton rubrum]|nr:hypothetical protein HL42_7522 [Trichophyton rubrum]
MIVRVMGLARVTGTGREEEKKRRRGGGRSEEGRRQVELLFWGLHHVRGREDWRWARAMAIKACFTDMFGSGGGGGGGGRTIKKVAGIVHTL